MNKFWNWLSCLVDEEYMLFDKEADFNDDPNRYVEISKALTIKKLLDYSICTPFWLFIYTLILPYLLYKVHIPSLIISILLVISLIIYLDRELTTLNKVVIFKSTWKEYIFTFILFNIVEVLCVCASCITNKPLGGNWYHIFFNPKINYIGLSIVLNFVLISRMLIYTYQKIKYHKHKIKCR